MVWCTDIHGNNNTKFRVVVTSGGCRGHVIRENFGVCMTALLMFSFSSWVSSSWAGDEDMS